LVALLKRETTAEEVNAAFKKASETTLKGILAYVDVPLVSCDFIGDDHSCIFDATMTTVIGGNLVKVMGWYDNEWGYSCRLVDMVNLIARKG